MIDESRVRLASRIAEYLALARTLDAKDSVQEYRAANALAWELAMLLPTDIYRMLVAVLVASDPKINAHTFAIHVRKWLLGADAGDLSAKELPHHAPDAKARDLAGN